MKPNTLLNEVENDMEINRKPLTVELSRGGMVSDGS